MSDFFEMWKKMSVMPGLEMWQKMAQSCPQDLWTSMANPWKPMIESFQKLGPQITNLWNDRLMAEYQKTLNQKTFGVFQDWDKKVFAQVQSMATNNLMKAYQKLLTDPSLILQDAKNMDPTVFLEAFQNMMSEYLKDMEIVEKDVKKISLEPLWETWTKMASGKWDEGMQKHAERFWESLRVKLTYGAEYYANPNEVQVGQTPHEVVWEKGIWKLYHYKAKGPSKGLPLFIVYAMINKPYIDDLLPGLSLIEHFTNKGLDVYLTDWGTPRYEDRLVTLDQVIEEGVGGMVKCICERHNVPQVSILGHCMGGALSVIYTTLHQDKVARLSTLTAPVTAKKGGVVSAWSYLSPIDVVVDTFGNVPAKLIRYTFIAMKPYYEVLRWQRYYTTLSKTEDKAMTVSRAVDKWVNDNVDIPGEFFRKFFNELYIKDSLVEGTMEIQGKKVQLSNITCPILNVFGEEDWIVPPDSAALLNDLVSSKEKTLRKIAGQHLGILFDPRNRGVWDEMVSFFETKPTVSNS